MKIYRKKLSAAVKKSGKPITFVVNSDNERLLDDNWKGLFNHIISSVDLYVDDAEALPSRVEFYLNNSHRHIESQTDDSENINTRADDGNEELLTLIEPRAAMADMVVPEHLLDEINEMIFYCQNKANIDKELVADYQSPHGIFINFHGPSGTGKTLAAEIIAGTLQKRLMVVNYANLESELVGRTSKNIHAIFKMADEQESVLMFDEADSFLSARITNLRPGAIALTLIETDPVILT